MTKLRKGSKKWLAARNAKISRAMKKRWAKRGKKKTSAKRKFFTKLPTTRTASSMQTLKVPSGGGVTIQLIFQK